MCVYNVHFFPSICFHSQLLSHVQLFCNPVDCSLPGFSVHGVFQARVLEWVAISYSRGFSYTGVKFVSFVFPALADRFFTTMLPGKPFSPLACCKQHNYLEIHWCCCLNQYYFKLLSSISLYGYTTTCISIHLLIDNWCLSCLPYGITKNKASQLPWWLRW